MDLAQKIKRLLHEADLYRSQGLLNESLERYTAATELIRKVGRIKNKESILRGIAKKARAVKQKLDAFEQAPKTPEMSKEIQDLIKDKFSFAPDDTAGALEGAIALAKFGQFERALDEFRNLLNLPEIRIPAAKNVIRCHISLEAYDEGIEEFQSWSAGGDFEPAQLENLRIFFQGILDKRGIDRTVTMVDAATMDFDGEIEMMGLDPGDASEIDEDELLDISSIGIFMDDGPQQGELVEFDVSFQSGNEVSLLVQNRDRALVQHLSVGTKLSSIEFYSPFAMFKGSGVITSNTKISTGPKRGDYSLDIKVTST
ncbi:hypothetical protein D3OALGA1CA_4818 [Olavius algarvensis associated proteobacterium Delta 3]|nr:hypothetical protein D3OALGB2SA_2094 [Olavius algarvensis associated proteobacterium Delta 3]CAB5157325.1 hypothetical protein D3OALGA1CA_4818 [Olavius algarvensis associated proteobacterium Delta 3]